VRLGVFTVLYSDTPFEEVLDRLAGLGVQAVELGTGGHPGTAHCDPDELLADESRVTALRRAIESRGMVISALSQHANPLHPDETVARTAHETWRKTAQRYESEPETNEGRKELAARAKAKEESRDKALSAYHMFEYGSAALQLAIVLAGASALTTVAWLMVMSIGLGTIGIAFAALGFFAPTLIHL